MTASTTLSSADQVLPDIARQDFVGWKRETLEQLAIDLLADNTRLRADLRLALDAHRQVIKREANERVSCKTQGGV